MPLRFGPRLGTVSLSQGDEVTRCGNTKSNTKRRRGGMLLAGVITGTIKLLIGLGIVIGVVITLLLVKVFGGRRS